MEIEKLIKDTFEAHEHLVPSDTEVLAAAQARIKKKRAMTRPLAVAAGVVVLTLAAVTAVVLNRPADNTTAAGQGAITTTDPASTAPAEPAVPPVTMPYSLDWLPPGDVAYLARRINIGSKDANLEHPLFGGEYMLSVTNDGQVLNIDVQEMLMSEPDEAAFKSGPGSPVTVGGRHGVESSVSDGPGGYELYLAHPGGSGSMYVNVAPSYEDGSTASAEQLIDVGRRVAENVRFPGDTLVNPAFGLRDLPAGLKVCAFDVERGFDSDSPSDGVGSTTGYELGDCTVMPPVQVHITGKDPDGTPGQPVLGHETRLNDEGGYRTLFILDAVAGEPIAVAGKVPAEQLYEIANHLVLPD